MNAMLIGKLTRGNGIPEHGRQDRLESCQIPDNSAINESVQGRHETFFEQRIDMLPVSRIPADE